LNKYLKNKEQVGVKFQGGSVNIVVVFDEFKAIVAEIQKVQGYLRVFESELTVVEHTVFCTHCMLHALYI